MVSVVRLFSYLLISRICNSNEIRRHHHVIFEIYSIQNFLRICCSFILFGTFVDETELRHEFFCSMLQSDKNDEVPYQIQVWYCSSRRTLIKIRIFFFFDLFYFLDYLQRRRALTLY